MDILPPKELHEGLEKFRHLLFHLQMQCGSIHEIFRFFKDENSMEHFEALKALDPQIMPQLLAREHVLEARHSGSSDAAIQHLKTALQLDPNCPEACFEYALLARTPELAMMWFQKSMDATVGLLGKAYFEELLAGFRYRPYQQLELHTYLKAKTSLAERLFRCGHYEVAALHFKDLVDWDHTDELNLHQFLMSAYLCLGNLQEAATLKRDFADDCSASWHYQKAFFQFKLEGDTRRSKRMLHRAFRRNLWVPLYLLGQKELPKKERPIDNLAFKEGSTCEAEQVFRCIAPVFVEDSKLTWWVWDCLRES